MGILESISNWETLPLSVVCDHLFELGYCCTIEYRPHNCETGKWISIKVENDGQKWGGIGGSRLDIARNRLVEWADKQCIRDFVKGKDKHHTMYIKENRISRQGMGATFSNCRKYRYALWRIWDQTKPIVMFIGLNPSTANELTDDPTIRRVKKFAADWGFGGVYMVNLFAFVTPYPEELKSCADAICDNDIYLKEIGGKCEQIIFAWGSFPEATERAEVVTAMFPNAKALVINRNGSPRHPLYVKGDVVPIIFNNSTL